MLLHPDFEKIYMRFIEQYGEEEGKAKYYAWLKANDYDDTKPLPKSETVAKFRNYQSFSWIQDVLPLPYPNTLKIVVLNTGMTRNQSVYVEDEMQKATRTMIEKPIFYGQTHNPEDKRVVGNVVWAEYEDGRIECVAVVEPEIHDLAKSGEVQKCSVETRYIYPEQVDGIKVHGLLFDGVLLVPNDVEVGDPQTSVTVLNRLYETVSQTHRQIDGGESKQKMSKEGDNPPVGNTGGQSGSTPHSGDGDVLTKEVIEEILDKRLQTLTETLQGLQKSFETFQKSFEDYKEQVRPEVLVNKTRKVLAKELGTETKPQGKGVVSDSQDIRGISDFSDLLRPDSDGKTGGQ